MMYSAPKPYSADDIITNTIDLGFVYSDQIRGEIDNFVSSKVQDKIFWELWSKTQNEMEFFLNMESTDLIF